MKSPNFTDLINSFSSLLSTFGKGSVLAVLIGLAGVYTWILYPLVFFGFLAIMISLLKSFNEVRITNIKIGYLKREIDKDSNSEVILKLLSPEGGQNPKRKGE